jgi:hypothetical protein
MAVTGFQLSDASLVPVIEATAAWQKTVTDPGVAAGSEWITRFNVLATDIMLRYPAEYTAAAVTGDSEGRLGFRGKIPEEFRSRIRALGGVSVAENVGYSATSVEAATAAAGAKLSERLSAIRIDMQLGKVTYVLTKSVSETEREGIAADWRDSRLVERAFEKAGAAVPALTIALATQEEAPVTSQAFQGGHALYGGYPGGSATPYCSTAVPIKRNGGPEIGVLTAAHCESTFSSGYALRGYTSSVAPILSVQAGSVRIDCNGSCSSSPTTGGEVRWYWSSQMFDGKTRVAAEEYTFRVVALPAQGTPMCVNGSFGGVWCTTATGGRASWITVCTDTYGCLAAGPFFFSNPLRYLGTVTRTTIPGDSGAAWFGGSLNNGVVYGIHHGIWSSTKEPLMSGSVYALSMLGVSLWTG